MELNKINVLFTSVGRRVELLRAFRNSYKKLKLKGLIYAVDIDKLAPALKVADKIAIVPRLDSLEYIPSLVQICKEETIDIIFPLIDPDIEVLSVNKELLEAFGTKVYVVGQEASKITNDKLLTREFFKQIGIRTPLSWIPEELNLEQIKYPIFIKPRCGSAAKDAFKVRNKNELLFFSKYIENPIIQEYLQGPEITNDVICHYDGDILGVISRQRIEVRSGEVLKGKTIYNQEIVESCKYIAEKLPACGPITVQCIMNDGVPYFTEINARLGGGIPLGIAAGADSPTWLLSKAAGLKVEIPPIGSYQNELYMTRYDESFFISK